MKIAIYVAAAIVLAVALLWALTALAHFADHEKWAQLTQAQRNWLQHRQIPNKPGYSCCTDADADEVEEDIRDGHYWARSNVTGRQWIQIPNEVVIHEPNRYGQPVAWWYWPEGKLTARCYAPGSGI